MSLLAGVVVLTIILLMAYQPVIAASAEETQIGATDVGKRCTHSPHGAY